MNVNSVLNCTLIIRSQVEYSVTVGTVILRCILEVPATGQRRGFTSTEDLLAALRAELMAVQNQIVPPDQQPLKNPTAFDMTPLPQDGESTGLTALDAAQNSPQ